MDIIPTNRRTEIVAATNDPRCVAIANRYGSFQEFNNKWSFEKLGYIAENVDNSVAEKVPSLVMMMLTYGQANIKNNLKLLLIATIKKMGETYIKMDDIDNIVRIITETKSLRLLNYAYLVTFFKRVEQGEFPLYACKPHQFMSAFQTYAKTALATQRILQAEVERAEEERERAEHRKNAITFEEFKRRTGLNGDNPLSDQK